MLYNCFSAKMFELRRAQDARLQSVQLALGLLHSQAMPTPTAAELAQVLEDSPW